MQDVQSHKDLQSNNFAMVANLFRIEVGKFTQAILQVLLMVALFISCFNFIVTIF